MNNQVKEITKKSIDISDWYQDVIEKANVAEHGVVRGTMVLKPYGYAMWESIQEIMNKRIKGKGVQNLYFPMFIPYSFLEKEKTHIEGFSPELAIVTHAGGEKLAEPLVVRPTSETIMYDAFSRWVESYRDLPLLVNQWNSVVRWEKRPYMFLRNTEFLWQEGHTAHKTEEEAREMVDWAIHLYEDIYINTLGLAGYVGKKSESEKFAGGKETYTYEMVMPDGKVLQGCTSHNLGQNFSKVFNVAFQDENGEKQFVWQTSWGYTTRSVGALILAHGDDNGLVLPPKIAPLKIVIIPILSKNASSELILSKAKELMSELEEAGATVKLDDKDDSVGYKFNKYELEGVPVRIEIGQKEIENNMLKIVRRDTREFQMISSDEVISSIEKLLEDIQNSLYEESKKNLLEMTTEVSNFSEFEEIMNTKRGFIKAFWCEDSQCEKEIKEKTKATTRCLPVGSIEESGKCVHCGKEAKYRWLFGLSY